MPLRGDDRDHLGRDQPVDPQPRLEFLKQHLLDLLIDSRPTLVDGPTISRRGSRSVVARSLIFAEIERPAGAHGKRRTSRQHRRLATKYEAGSRPPGRCSLPAAQVITAADEASTALQHRVVQARRDNRVRLARPATCVRDDLELLRAVAAKATLPQVLPDVQRELDRLTTEVGQATDDLRKVTGFGRLLLFGGTRDKANQAAQFLADYRRWFLASRLRDEIERPHRRDDPRVRAVRISDALADWVGFAHDLPDHGKTASIEAVVVVRETAQCRGHHPKGRR